MGLKTAIKIRRIDGGLAAPARRRARSVRGGGGMREEGRREGLANDVTGGGGRSDQLVGPTHQRVRLSGPSYLL